MKELFGEVIGFVDLIPDAYIDSEWDLIKRVQFGETLIPNKYKELTGAPSASRHPPRGEGIPEESVFLLGDARGWPWTRAARQPR